MTQHQLETRRGFTLLKEERKDVFSSDDEEDPEQTEYLVRIWCISEKPINKWVTLSHHAIGRYQNRREWFQKYIQEYYKLQNNIVNGSSRAFLLSSIWKEPKRFAEQDYCIKLGLILKPQLGLL